MTVAFKLEEQNFTALNGGPHFKLNQSISFFVYCESEAKIENIYKKLSEGGFVMMPLDKYDWSPKYAWVQDKFGLSWQIVPTVLGKLMSDSEKAPGVIQAFMKMKKFDIEALINA